VAEYLELFQQQQIQLSGTKQLRTVHSQKHVLTFDVGFVVVRVCVRVCLFVFQAFPHRKSPH
jgi:hypothetical protein